MACNIKEERNRRNQMMQKKKKKKEKKRRRYPNSLKTKHPIYQTLREKYHVD